MRQARPKSRRNTAPPAAPTLSGPPVRLSDSDVEAWRTAVVALARFPRGTDRRGWTLTQSLDLVLRQERDAVGDLWAAYNTERNRLSRRLLTSQRQVVAYLLGFHLANLARATVTLERADARHGLKDWLKRSNPAPLLWHDLGAGSGALTQAALRFFGNDQATAHLYDGAGSLLDAAKHILAGAAPDAKVQTHRIPLERLDATRLAAPSNAHLVGYGLGYVWNEVNPAAQSRVLTAISGALGRNERVVVLALEPAVQTLARGAMALRDQLVELGMAPLYPCPRAGVACPMLRRTRDWCYSEATWQRPREILQLDRALGMDRGRLSGGFYLFVSPRVADELRLAPSDRPIVVGRPRGDRHDEYLLCSGDTLEKRPAPRDAPLARGLAL